MSDIRKAAIVGLLTQYEICAFLPEHEILAALKINFAKSDPDGGHFNQIHMDELDGVLAHMHTQWVEDNVGDFDEFLAKGEAYRFLAWNIVGRTLLCAESCKYLDEVLSVVEEVEDGYEYDYDDVFESLEDYICESDEHYYAVENIYDLCDAEEQGEILACDKYEAFCHLLESRASECCDIKYSRLLEKIEQNAAEIARELKSFEAFDQGYGSGWHWLFEEADEDDLRPYCDPYMFPCKDENAEYYRELMEMGWDPEAEIK